MTGAESALARSFVAGSTDMDSTSPVSAAGVVVPTGGAVLAIVAGATGSTTAKAWGAGITEDQELNVGNYCHTTAFTTTGATVTVSCTGGTNGEDGALAGVVFSQTVTRPITNIGSKSQNIVTN